MRLSLLIFGEVILVELKDTGLRIHSLPIRSQLLLLQI